MRKVALILGVCLAGLASAQQASLNRYRFGLSADRIVGMGFDRWDRYFNGRVEPSGVTRGVSYAVYVDAMREQNGRLLRRLPASRQATFRRASSLIKQYSDRVGETEWLFSGGNAYDPKGDSEELARAEGRMLRIALGQIRPSASANTLMNLDASLAARQNAYARSLASASRRALRFSGGGDRSRSQVAAEVNGTPNRLRALTAQIKTDLRREPVGVRYEALTILQALTKFEAPR